MGEHHALRVERPAEHSTIDASRSMNTAQGFGSEFRHLAQQQRFSRHRDVAPPTSATPDPRMHHASPAVPSGRISSDARSMLLELSRMADRVIESREQLAAERERCAQLTAQIENVQQRFIAARAIVHDAQQTAHAAAERCEFLEGRCEALQDALDLALNASVIQRWKWRRRMRNSARAGESV